MNTRTALITGASKGFGFALASTLAKQGWKLLINARNPQELLRAKKKLSKQTDVIALAGDVRDEVHLLELAEAVEAKGWKLDLVINNASSLGHSPLKRLLDFPVEALHTVLHTNMIAPVSLLQKIAHRLNSHAIICNISSDAAAEAYETWGPYGGSKAGLDHISAILAKENPKLHVYSFDPGDMRTEMHQAAFPGEDISDRPLPEDQAVPGLIELIESGAPSGRYTVESKIVA